MLRRLPGALFRYIAGFLRPELIYYLRRHLLPFRRLALPPPQRFLSQAFFEAAVHEDESVWPLTEELARPSPFVLLDWLGVTSAAVAAGRLSLVKKLVTAGNLRNRAHRDALLGVASAHLRVSIFQYLLTPPGKPLVKIRLDDCFRYADIFFEAHMINKWSSAKLALEVKRHASSQVCTLAILLMKRHTSAAVLRAAEKLERALNVQCASPPPNVGGACGSVIRAISQRVGDPSCTLRNIIGTRDAALVRGVFTELLKNTDFIDWYRQFGGKIVNYCARSLFGTKDVALVELVVDPLGEPGWRMLYVSAVCLNADAIAGGALGKLTSPPDQEDLMRGICEANNPRKLQEALAADPSALGTARIYWPRRSKHTQRWLDAVWPEPPR